MRALILCRESTSRASDRPILSVNDLLHALGKRENGEAVHQGDKTLKAGCLQVFRNGRNVPIFRQFFHQTNTVIDVEDDKFNALGVQKDVAPTRTCM